MGKTIFETGPVLRETAEATKRAAMFQQIKTVNVRPLKAITLATEPQAQMISSYWLIIRNNLCITSNKTQNTKSGRKIKGDAGLMTYFPQCISTDICSQHYIWSQMCPRPPQQELFDHNAPWSFRFVFLITSDQINKDEFDYHGMHCVNIGLFCICIINNLCICLFMEFVLIPS